MPIPNEFQYQNEEAFIADFLIPLLHRLGFTVVTNYHGQREFGKDLVFGQISPFGHVIYHGLQAKYVPSVSLSGIEEVIADAKQAFANPFLHPQKGNQERISTFFAVNGGSISDEASIHYFNSLAYPFGGNVRLIDGKGLLALDKLANYNRGAWAGERLTGVILEARINREVAKYMVTQMEAYLKQGARFPLKRLRVHAALAFLERPILQDLNLYSMLHDYWQTGTAINEVAESMGASVTGGSFKQDRFEGLVILVGSFDTLAAAVESTAAIALATLMPSSGV
jgi:hypothetical protein